MKKKSWEESLCKDLNDDKEFITWLIGENKRLKMRLFDAYLWSGVIFLMIAIVFFPTI